MVLIIYKVFFVLFAFLQVISKELTLLGLVTFFAPNNFFLNGIPK